MTSLLCSLQDLVKDPVPSRTGNTKSRRSYFINHQELRDMIVGAIKCAQQQFELQSTQAKVRFDIILPDDTLPDDDACLNDLDQTIRLFFEEVLGKQGTLLSNVSIEEGFDKRVGKKIATIRLSFTKQLHA